MNSTNYQINPTSTVLPYGSNYNIPPAAESSFSQLHQQVNNKIKTNENPTQIVSNNSNSEILLHDKRNLNNFNIPNQNVSSVQQQLQHKDSFYSDQFLEVGLLPQHHQQPQQYPVSNTGFNQTAVAIKPANFDDYQSSNTEQIIYKQNVKKIQIQQQQLQHQNFFLSSHQEHVNFKSIKMDKGVYQLNSLPSSEVGKVENSTRNLTANCTDALHNNDLEGSKKNISAMITSSPTTSEQCFSLPISQLDNQKLLLKKFWLKNNIKVQNLNSNFDFPKIFTLITANGFKKKFYINLINKVVNIESHNQLKDDLIEYTEHFLSKTFPYIPDPQQTNIRGSQDQQMKMVVNKKKILPTLQQFLRVIFNKTKLSLSTLATAIFFLKKLKLNHPNCKGSEGSGHRLILASIIVASKYNYDDTFDNKAWQTVGNGLFSLEDLNKMESEFLLYLNYKIFVKWEDWMVFCSELELDIKEYFFHVDGSVERLWNGPLVFELKVWDEVDELGSSQQYSRNINDIFNTSSVVYQNNAVFWKSYSALAQQHNPVVLNSDNSNPSSSYYGDYLPTENYDEDSLILHQQLHNPMQNHFQKEQLILQSFGNTGLLRATHHQNFVADQIFQKKFEYDHNFQKNNIRYY
ncbi:hypothetical protein HK099_001997 [Clydaea vesicula]|uniref:Cyclin N-terminal domain-containing protein n=1 Tax=Clydaea vesicula TaxID=447962 RepID=A0AAD5TXY0_9FUNG|nr:hypothetical protein HK099_001997 [Clydaea vesicula]